jgi:hypothetical protein
MNTAIKLIQAMRQNPRDWRIEQLQSAAKGSMALSGDMTAAATAALCEAMGRRYLCQRTDQSSLFTSRSFWS